VLVPPPPDPIAEAWSRAVAERERARPAARAAALDSIPGERPWERRSFARSTTVFEKFPGNPVVPLGGRGAFDRGHAEYPSVVIAGDLMWMYYAAYGLRHRWEIAAAVSSDGIAWKKLGVVLAPDSTEGAWDAGSLASPCVIHVPEARPDERFQMWYAGKSREAYDGIGFATSANGREWLRRGRVLGRGEPGSWDSSQIVDAAVVAVDGGYRMYYCGSAVIDGLFKAGLALSADGRNWVKFPDSPVYAVPGAGFYTLDVLADDEGFTLFVSAPDADRGYEIHAVHSADGLAFDHAGSRLVLAPARDNSWEAAMVYGMEALSWATWSTSGSTGSTWGKWRGAERSARAGAARRARPTAGRG
jgi:predicted GH43/DUF377 family glycosyl hydrolase